MITLNFWVYQLLLVPTRGHDSNSRCARNPRIFSALIKASILVSSPKKAPKNGAFLCLIHKNDYR